MQRLVSTFAFWLTTKPDEEDRGPWLAFPIESKPGWFMCREELEVGEVLSAVVAQSRQIPEYFAIGLEIAGRKILQRAPDLRQWHYMNYVARGGSGPRKTYEDPPKSGRLLATATPAEAGADGVRLGFISPVRTRSSYNSEPGHFGLVPCFGGGHLCGGWFFAASVPLAASCD
jgi:hypothetical protein